MIVNIGKENCMVITMILTQTIYFVWHLLDTPCLNKEGIENEKQAELELGIGKAKEAEVDEGPDVHNEGFIAEAPKQKGLN